MVDGRVEVSELNVEVTRQKVRSQWLASHGRCMEAYFTMVREKCYGRRCEALTGNPDDLISSVDFDSISRADGYLLQKAMIFSAPVLLSFP